MEVTATIQVQNAPFSGVEEHVEHKEKQKHSNENINFEDTKFNQKLEFETTEYEENLFSPELEKFNEKQKETGHQKRQKKLDEYIKSKQEKWSKRAIATFGNSEIQKEILAGKDPEERAQILKKESQGLLNFVDRFNQENSNFKIFKAVTNVDENKEEIGAPHVHMDIRPISRTGTKHKISMNINNALRAEFKKENPKESVPKDNRELMSWWREKNDKFLIEEMSKSLRMDFKLERKERQKSEMGLSMEEYQQRRKEKQENLDYLKIIDPTATITWKKEKSGEVEETDPLNSPNGEKEAISAPREAIWARLRSASSHFRETTQRRINELKTRIRDFRDQLEERKSEIKRKRDEIDRRERETEQRRKRLKKLKIKCIYKKANEYGLSKNENYKDNVEFMKNQPSRTSDPNKNMFDDVTHDLQISEKDPFKYDVVGKNGQIFVINKNSGKSLFEIENPKKLTSEQKRQNKAIQSIRRDELEDSHLKSQAFKHFDKANALDELPVRERVYLKGQFHNQVLHDNFLAKKKKKSSINFNFSENDQNQENINSNERKINPKRGFHM